MHRSFLYANREHAARKLAELLLRKHMDNPFVLGLPRGGVILAKIVATQLEASFDVIVSRKIGMPGDSELGIGAVSEDEIPFLIRGFSSLLDPESSEVKLTIKREIKELRRRVGLYRNGKVLPLQEGQNLIVVDDGLATGVTAIAAGKF